MTPRKTIASKPTFHRKAMPPNRKRKDNNQAELVRYLTGIGCTVLDMSDHGHGVPDLLIAKNGRTCFAEVKHPGKAPRPNQQDWHDNWRGVVFVIHDARECHMLHDWLMSGQLPAQLQHNQPKPTKLNAKNTLDPDPESVNDLLWV